MKIMNKKELKPIDHEINKAKESGCSIEIGTYTIMKLDKKTVWIETWEGEGMTIDTHELFKVIDKFYKYNF